MEKIVSLGMPVVGEALSLDIWDQNVAGRSDPCAFQNTPTGAWYTKRENYQGGKQMKFLHTADWHLGKRLDGYDLGEDQAAIFQQIEQIAKDEQVDAIVIAGDLYDRAVPSEAAVAQLQGMLRQLNLTDHFPILAVSGNHDSAPRLGIGDAWYQATQLYLNTHFAESFDPIEVAGTQFFLLPFFNLQAARNYFEDDSLKTVNAAMTRVVEEMKTRFAPDKPHVLVGHFFAAGSQHTADSETMVEVGGLNAVDTSLFADFDYVALGHLHNKEALQDERIKYSGSPLKLSLSEAKVEKGVWIVDTDPFKLTWRELHQSPDLQILRGSFAELIEKAQNHEVNRENYYRLEIEDDQLIPDAAARLKEYYPRLLETRWPNQQWAAPADEVVAPAAAKDPLKLLEGFYTAVTDRDLSDQQLEWAKETLAQAKEENE